MPPLTQQAHNAVRLVVKPGDTVIDATTGNGHDTRFLAELVGSTGRVYAFDIQPQALQQTEHGLPLELRSVVALLRHDHARMDEFLPAGDRGKIAAVMFNLGYLPGSDHQLVTQTASTLRALTTALDWLRPGGVLSVIAYPGHPGGAEETDAVCDWFAAQASLIVISPQVPTPAPRAPRWLAGCKLVTNEPTAIHLRDGRI